MKVDADPVSATGPLAFAAAGQAVLYLAGDRVVLSRPQDAVLRDSGYRQTVPEDPDERTLTLEGLAAIAVTVAEMGGTPEDVMARVGPYLFKLGLATGDDVRAVAAAIARLPQRMNESAEIRERRKPIERMLGLTSAEEALVASLTAREALETLAAALSNESPN